MISCITGNVRSAPDPHLLSTPGGGCPAFNDVAQAREPLASKGQGSRDASWCLTPVVRELCDHREEREDLDTGVEHARVRQGGRRRVERARCISDNEDLRPTSVCHGAHIRVLLRSRHRGALHATLAMRGPGGHSRTERQERDANVGGDSGDDELLLARGRDCIAERLVVPRVDLALALYVRCVGVVRKDLLGDRTIWTRLRGRRDNRREVEVLGCRAVAVNVVAVHTRLHVVHDLEEASLDVDDERSCIGAIEAVVRQSGRCGW